MAPSWVRLGLRAEADEDVGRQDFAPSEKVAIGQAPPSGSAPNTRDFLNYMCAFTTESESITIEGALRP